MFIQPVGTLSLICYFIRYDETFSGKRDMTGWGSKCQQTCDNVYIVYKAVQ